MSDEEDRDPDDLSRSLTRQCSRAKSTRSRSETQSYRCTYLRRPTSFCSWLMRSCFFFSFRQVSKGGYTMDPDPTKAMSAKSINARFSRCAESAGLKPKGGRGISFTGFRNCVASEVRTNELCYHLATLTMC